MKVKGLLVVAVVCTGLLFGMTSCKGGYTCPTYLENDQDSQDTEMVKTETESEAVNC